MAMALWYTNPLAQAIKLLSRLSVDFFLDGRKIHWDIAAIGNGQWLDDMENMKLRLILLSQRSGSLYDCLGRVSQIDCRQNVLIGHTRFTRGFSALKVAKKAELVLRKRY
jgi:hypothetical protein